MEAYRECLSSYFRDGGFEEFLKFLDRWGAYVSDEQGCEFSRKPEIVYAKVERYLEDVRGAVNPRETMKDLINSSRKRVFAPRRSTPRAARDVLSFSHRDRRKTFLNAKYLTGADALDYLLMDAWLDMRERYDLYDSNDPEDIVDIKDVYARSQSMGKLLVVELSKISEFDKPKGIERDIIKICGETIK